MARTPTIMLLAGEASGDQHGSDVARELLRRWPQARLVGMGGPQMAEAGVDLFASLDRLAVMGFVEVLSRLDYFRTLERHVESILAEGAVDLVIPIDYPGFNLRVTAMSHRLGVPVLFYIAPQVWAWKAGRAKRLAETASHIAVILPFEVPIFEAHGARVSFVGHPLLDHQPGDPVWLQGAPDPQRPLLALLPGSRGQELRRHLDPMIATARAVQRSRPDVQVAVAVASGVGSLNLPDDILTARGGRALLGQSSVALVKSGTSTLEAALAGVPFVCVYRTHPITFALAKQLVNLDSIALANLVARAPVVPEYIQDAFKPDEVAAQLLELLDPEGEARVEMLHGLKEIHANLGTAGAASRVADVAARLIAGQGKGGPGP